MSDEEEELAEEDSDEDTSGVSTLPAPRKKSGTKSSLKSTSNPKSVAKVSRKTWREDIMATSPRTPGTPGSPFKDRPASSPSKDELFFSDESEARDFVDEVITLDTDRPEMNGMFFVQRINEHMTADNVHMFNLIKITVPMIDFRDLLKYKAYFVLGGTALLIQYPAVPHWLLHDHKHKAGEFHKESLKGLYMHSGTANDVRNDPTRQVKRILVKFSGKASHKMVCTATNMMEAPYNGLKLQIQLREMEDVPSALPNGETKVQSFYPVFWIVKIISEKHVTLQLDEDAELEDEYVAALTGMRI